jgi:spermidine synthase
MLRRADLALALLIAAAGGAALSWEVIWQIYAGLALGVSTTGASLTLVATMGGMGLGAWAMGRLLRRPSWDGLHPLKIYAGLEVIVGMSGLLLGPGFALLEALDRAAWQVAPALGSALHLLGIIMLLGPASFAMGATIPVIGRLAQRSGLNLSRLYAWNTAGAALGTLAMAFGALPELGVSLSARLLVLVDLCVAALAWLLASRPDATARADADSARPIRAGASWGWARVVVAATGFATFAMEVAWFRALRAAFQSTTETFAIILVAVLVPLAVGSRLTPWIRRRGLDLGLTLAGAGIGIVAITPVIERLDLLAPSIGHYWLSNLCNLLLAAGVIGLPVLLLGTALPWILDEQDQPGRWGTLYAINTAGAVVGASMAGWVLLPWLGTSRTAWLVGGSMVAVALPRLSPRGRTIGFAGAVGALVLALATQSGAGRDRVQGRTRPGVGYKVLDFAEAPDATVAVLEYDDGQRVLLIDGFQATAETHTADYMTWMGRLPMLLHDQPGRALVICFGTGQTANALRREGPTALDVVELSETVLRMADRFTSNERILTAPMVEATVMDGRAWLRRTERRYDVITLEPMPPNFAGVNALYSVEFYELMASRMNPGALAAQWLPFHIVSPEHAAAITAAFHAVFPDSILWLDPIGGTGILLGRHDPPPDPPPLASVWPGLTRSVSSGPAARGRTLTHQQIRDAVVLNKEGVARYAALAAPVTDDNQVLAYGRGRLQKLRYGGDLDRVHRAVLERIRGQGPASR